MALKRRFRFEMEGLTFYYLPTGRFQVYRQGEGPRGWDKTLEIIDEIKTEFATQAQAREYARGWIVAEDLVTEAAEMERTYR